MTNHRDAKVVNLSACPLCEEEMETPQLDLTTGKSNTTACPKCGTQRTIAMPAETGRKVWN